MVKRLLICLLAGSLLAINTAPAAHAASPPVNLEISPLPILLNAKPGTSTSSDLRVRNAASTDVVLKASVKTFTAEGADGHIVFHNPGPADEFVNWIHFSKTVFNAPAGAWQTIKMTVDVPAGAAFGYYWAVQFEPAAASTAAPGGASVRGAVAIFTLLNADAPGAKRSIDVTSFSVERRSYEFLPVNFSVATHNSGNTHVAPTGNVFIKRGGKQVGVLSLNPNGGFVLPGSNRIFTTAWSDGFPVYKPVLGTDGQPVRDKNGKLKQHLTWNFSQVPKLRFGHYTATLLLVYNDGTRDIPVSGTVSFWVVPWRLILIILAVLIIPPLAVYLIMRRRFRKRLEKERQKPHHG
jgi:hypothetical protein